MIKSAIRTVEVTTELVDALRTFSATREVEHCGAPITVSAFDLYATCPRCKARFKLRGFSASPDLADLFDSFFEWMSRPENAEAVNRRRQEIHDDRD